MSNYLNKKIKICFNKKTVANLKLTTVFHVLLNLFFTEILEN
ncbi:hypothetical protein FEM21_10880 [Flavobacterium seoulense]|uniref:Uncharacterized protein n=1 Tax=Flavobacterium seoulense TaxID=1492738 RepID=A0A066WPD0_9FLAO|nr:hypothetical protein FEM21_10880 [Flavobacterium seoulense]